MSALNIIRWPEGVAAILDVSNQTLQARRADGDCPKLYAPTPRVLVTTEKDLLDWILGKEVDDGYKCRPSTRRGVARP
ncbi:MAG: hypothetical protein CVU32_01845 [Betaproteobacteria bacterium HGW-Betaproteobacteria-5]|jgi:hypothetical protein|nr:MAG: hypothetical protein CVU32_01845 [Betaproteobacteria bacterium HGW-Betaproteobacteria-5]PKO40154.1 MAG: hypothetical protein CVU33_03050 [Betaproteobacteria bacterium HGW-Betaproteobacteria-6]PKO93185.1 MAG: hypothetical protein CVU16_05775 [Betaproteobacteria bacterium HGW-Betaproteobacteria-10]